MKTQFKTVDIYDTTLRDGGQAVGLNLSLSDKLKIALRLSDLGVQYIEGGWPNETNKTDLAFYREIKKQRLSAKIAAFGSTRRPRTTCGQDIYMKALVATGAPVVTIYGKSWDLHVKKVIKTSLGENLDIIAESVEYLKKHFEQVFFDAEHFFDGFRSNAHYALETVRAAEAAGADCVILCDTNGTMLPDEFLKIFKETYTIAKKPLGIHMHNDSGCAEANSILAVLKGAVQVQGTMNGLGERCGNANLCTIIPSLQLKRGYRILAPEKLKTLMQVSVFVSEVANVAPNIRQPYVGEAAFSHKAGAHADGVRKVRESFEHINPDDVGNVRRFVVSNQAGSGTILENLSEIRPGLDKTDPRVQKLLMRIKELEAEGYHFEAADASFELIARQVLDQLEQPFIVKGFRVIEEKLENGALRSEATIKVQEGNEFEHTAAEGDGPVNALDNALRKALVKFFPALKEVKLEDFKVRVLDGKEGTAAKVRVLIESSDGTDRWGTIGVSTNIIEASWLALIDSLMYKLMKNGSIKYKGNKKERK